MKLFACFLCLFFQFEVFAQKTFEIEVSGHVRSLKILQARAELRAVESTDQCRGFYISKAIKPWDCKKISATEKSCTRVFSCKATTKNFNRNSEIKRLSSLIPKEPAKQIKKKKNFQKKIKNQNKLSELDRELKDMAALNTSNIKKEKGIDWTKDDELDRELKTMEVDVLENLDIEALGKDEVELSKLNSTKSTDTFKEEAKKLNPRYERVKDAHNITASSFLAFSTDLVRTSNELDSSWSVGLSWIPRRVVTSELGIRGQLGVKSLKLLLDNESLMTQERFYVIDIGAFLFLTFNPRLFVEVGYFLEKWNNSNSETNGAFSFGGGYLFEHKLLKYFDRLVLNYSTVSNRASNKELKASLGFVF